MQKQILQQITDFCNSEAGQAEVRKLADAMKKQGVTRLFVNPQKVFNLIKEMKKYGVLDASVDEKLFSVEEQEEGWVKFFTICLRDYLAKVPNIDVSKLQPMLEELVYYVQLPKRTYMLFNWMFENVIPLRTKLKDVYLQYCAQAEIIRIGGFAEKPYSGMSSFLTKYDYVRANISKMLEDAIPCGVNMDIKCEEWIENHPYEFKSLDDVINILMEYIPCDDLMKSVFKDDAPFADTTPDMSKDLKGIPGVTEDFLRFGTRDEIKAKVAQIFKKFILDVAFEECKELEIATDNEIGVYMVNMLKQKPTFVRFKYLQALFQAYKEENEKLLKQLRKYFDANGVEYSMTNQESHEIQEAIYKNLGAMFTQNTTGFWGHNIPN